MTLKRKFYKVILYCKVLDLLMKNNRGGKKFIVEAVVAELQ